MEDFTVVGEGIRKLLHLMEDLRNVRYKLPAAVRCDNRYILLRVSMSLSGQKGMSPLGNFE